MAQPDVTEPLNAEKREELRRWFVGQEALYRGTRVQVRDIDLWRRASVKGLERPDGYSLLVRLSDLHFEPQSVFPLSASRK